MTTNKNVAIIADKSTPDHLISMISRKDFTPICVSKDQKVLSNLSGLGYKTMSVEALEKVEVAIIIIAVQPLEIENEFNLNPLEEIVTEIAKGVLSKQSSTPLIVFAGMSLSLGAISDTLIKLLEEVSGSSASVDFDVAYLPEFPWANRSEKILTGGLTKTSVKVLKELFLSKNLIFNQVSLEEAEMVEGGKSFLKITQKATLDEIARLCKNRGVNFEKVLPFLVSNKQVPIQATPQMLASVENLIPTMPVVKKAWEALSSVSEKSLSTSQVPVAGRRFATATA